MKYNSIFSAIERGAFTITLKRPEKMNALEDPRDDSPKRIPVILGVKLLV